jgi:uncharacterized surface protein with fasciclin (FAS1) repeats
MKRHLTLVTAVAAALVIGSSAWAGISASAKRIAPEGPAVSSSFRSNAPNVVERLERLGDFSILLTALATANLEDALATGGPFTLFAPTDRAFADLLAQLGITAPELLASPDLPSILLYHVAPGRQRTAELLRSSTQETLNPGRPVLVVLEGKRVVVNRAKVVRANVPASNGLIHVIDEVLLPPEDAVTIAGVADVLALDGRFSVLLEALQRTGLDDALAGDGPFTVFAPTDEAFGDLLADLNVTADELLADPNLTDILLYHVLGRRAGAIQLVTAPSVQTLQGDEVIVRPGRGGIYVNDALVINPNVNAPNGFIHTIDKVLVP